MWPLKGINKGRKSKCGEGDNIKLIGFGFERKKVSMLNQEEGEKFHRLQIL